VPGRLPAGIIGIPVEIGVGHPCDPTGRLDFQISARYAGGDHDDPHALSLNGLPPGEPYIGYLDLETGGNGIVSVAVSFPNGYDPAAPYEIVLDADTDGDGVLERQCGTRVVSTYDEEETVDAPGDATFEESVRLQTAPNPFSGRSTIGFALARPSQVELGVYDLGGRLVRSLKRGMLPAGAQRFEWDGRDSRGREVAGGIYFVKLHAERVSLEAKLVKLR
jgi:hypothetical protein